MVFPCARPKRTSWGKTTRNCRWQDVTLTKGKGKVHPFITDRVRVHYSGWTTDGKLFDSSVQRGEPAEFPLNGVIRGWTRRRASDGGRRQDAVLDPR